MTTLDDIAEERTRITEGLAQLDAERAKLTEELLELEATERVFARLNRPRSARRTGKATTSLPQTRSARAPQSRRGSKREAILQLVKENPGGLGRGELLEKLGLKGDKSGEMSVSNALTALTKNNQVVRSEGKYRAA